MKKRLWNKIMRNILMDKNSMRNLTWMYFMRSFLAFFSILPSFHFSFLNLNWIPSQFEQQQWVILRWLLLLSLSFSLGSNQANCTEQLINSPVWPKWSASVSPVFVCVVWGSWSCGRCVGISPWRVHPPHSSYLTEVLYLQSGNAELKKKYPGAKNVLVQPFEDNC